MTSPSKDVLIRETKKYANAYPQSTLSQRKRSALITSIGQPLPICNNSSYFLIFLPLLSSIVKISRYAHLSNRARLRKVSSSIALWIFHRGCSCAPWKFMPNNSPPGIQRRFTSAELPRENISTLTPDKLLHLESRIDSQRFFLSR